MSRRGNSINTVLPFGTCFGIVSSLWVCVYETLVPNAHHAVVHGHNLDELQESATRLRDRRQDLYNRLTSCIVEAKRFSRKDPKAFRNKVSGVRRLKSQLNKMDESIAALESNIDQVMHSDITRDIIDSFKKSAAAIKSSGTQLGPPDSINDFMEELQAQMQTANEVADTVYSRQFYQVAEEATDEELLQELDMILLDESGVDRPAAADDSAVITEYPSLPIPIPRENSASSMLLRRGNQQHHTQASSSESSGLLSHHRDEAQELAPL